MEDDRQKEPVIIISQRDQKKLDRERLVAERANAERALAHEYGLIKNSPAFVDLIAKIKGFSSMHIRVASDAVGYENKVVGFDDDGNERTSQELTHLEPHERLRELDKSAGQDEILTYIERKLDIDR